MTEIIKIITILHLKNSINEMKNAKESIKLKTPQRTVNQSEGLNEREKKCHKH